MKRQYVQVELCRVRAPDGGEDFVQRALFPITPQTRLNAMLAIELGEARLVEIDDDPSATTPTLFITP